MALVVDKFRSLLPPRSKSSPSGWISFNAPCCHHRGHKSDTRKRAGIRFEGNGIIYNCFNCKFTTGWKPGSPLGEKMKTLCRWLGANEDTIKEIIFESLKSENTDDQNQDTSPVITFEEKTLPENSMSLKEWSTVMEGEIEDELGNNFSLIVEYLLNRGFENPFEYDFYWSPTPGYIDRVIIPFRYNEKIVGNTARKILDGKPKYLSDQQPNFVFNIDKQQENQRYIFVVEGPFDALSINGVALLTNDISEQQSRIINSLRAEVIVIPDQDQSGLVLYDRANELGWSVAVPNWEEDIKDCAEAVLRYGKLFVAVDAIKTAVKGPIKITMAKNKLKSKLQRITDEKIN
jgi:hypothetical protein